MKLPRVLVLCLLSALGGGGSVAADEVDDALIGLGRVANEGNYDYPLRVIAREEAAHPTDPRFAHFRAALLQARAQTFGAAANGPVAVESIPVKLQPFTESTPRDGRSFTTETAHVAMVWIPAGKLLMSAMRGSDDDTVVTLSHGYWLGRTEVTQAQWATVMDNLPRPSLYRGGNRPVERISWVSAMAFCRRLTESERTAGRLPPDFEYSLPTEAEWEYACRAGDAGNVPVTPEMGWCCVNSGQMPHSVAQKRPNAWGLYDMHGNVWEWCVDGYQGYPGGAVTDLQGDDQAPSAATFRILRGGGFASTLGECRADYRQWNPLNAGNAGIGFRLALTPISATTTAGSPVPADATLPNPVR